MTLTRRLSFLVVFLLLIGSIVTPLILLTGIAVRLSDIIVLLILPLILVMYIAEIKINNLSLLYFIAMIQFGISTIRGYILLDVPFSYRDINELIRMAIPFVIIITFNIINIKSSGHAFSEFFRFTTPFLVIFSFFQWLQIVPEFILQLYGGKDSIHVSQLLSATKSSIRIIATGTDPNIGAMILVIYLFYNCCYFFQYKTKSNFVLSVLILVLIILSASRTTLLALVFVVCVITFFSASIRLFHRIVLLFSACLVAVYTWYSSDYVRIGIKLFIQGENKSWLVRIDNFKDVIELLMLSPVWGWGPAKAIHTTLVDGEYFLILRRYGLVGLSTILIFYCYSFYKVYTFSKTKKIALHDLVIANTLLLYSLVIFIFMITNNVLSSYQLALPYFIMLSHINKVSIDVDIKHSSAIRKKKDYGDKYYTHNLCAPSR